MALYLIIRWQHRWPATWESPLTSAEEDVRAPKCGPWCCSSFEFRTSGERVQRNGARVIPLAKARSRPRSNSKRIGAFNVRPSPAGCTISAPVFHPVVSSNNAMWASLVASTSIWMWMICASFCFVGAGRRSQFKPCTVVQAMHSPDPLRCRSQSRRVGPCTPSRVRRVGVSLEPPPLPLLFFFSTISSQ